MSNLYYIVGKIVNTHGIRGELKVISETDFPERFNKGNQLFLNTRQNILIPIIVENVRIHKKVLVLKFVGYDSINQVEAFKDCFLKIHTSSQLPLENGQYYVHQIIGCKVLTEDEELLGEVCGVLSPGANDVWIIRTSHQKEILIPVIDDVIISVNIINKKIYIKLMEGLIE